MILNKDLKICIAGKNHCSIDIVNYLIKKKFKSNLIILPNISDKGNDKWQPSLKKFAKKNKIKIVNLKDLYNLENLIFFSIEYEKILNLNKFKSTELFNIHFSLLPKYRGCHTNYLQIKNGEKKSGVTLHKIDPGIDTGEILDKISFKININHTAKRNYEKLMKYSVIIFKKNLLRIINSRYKTVKQGFKNASYFKRNFVNYNIEKYINLKNHNLKNYNKIRALIFPPYQYPIINGNKVIAVKYKKNKLKLKFS